MNLWLPPPATAGSGHELVARRTRHRGLVQVELVRDLTQGERAHGEITILEEVLLSGNHGFSNALNRQEPLFEVPHEPTCFLQMLREESRLPIARLPEVVGVLLVYPDARIDGGVHAHHPALLFLADDHIRHDR